MPPIAHRNVTSGNAMEVMRCLSQGVNKESVSKEGIWSNRSNDVSLERLQKFWGELPPHARQELLRVDKQTFFESARKNMYCSRCNGLLVERFAQIVRYGKLSQQEGVGLSLSYRAETFQNDTERKLNAVENPSSHSWGGLVATRDGTLTLMDNYVYGDSLHSIQNVFDYAQVREHERNLEFPDACGGGGRGWISHGMTNYGRVHGLRETCALHTSRLFCDTLVDFFSPLGEDSQLKLLQMKEEDFIERLMHRFDSKRFCRDCRKNVIREFKELKELKRLSRETCCTSWFCTADTAFQYEVTCDTVRASWNKSFTDAVEKYHHFEWAIGTGEGKSDILEFEDVGMAGEVQVNGLELDDLDACFITLRACKLDGHSTDLTVKAHALKGRPCVHCWLVVGDGFVRITEGGNIREFFEHAEEAEEEEDDDAVDEDGNDLDREGSRPQKHAKSPELAREFLLDAATVIFKEQVEKAFRESIARQNAHHTFVCLALKLLEERIHVACKEIITLEKQVKLLEEEENERGEEEERKQRRRAKEKEKKLRRKERLREKEKAKEKEIEDHESDLFFTFRETSACKLFTGIAEEPPTSVCSQDLSSEKGEDTFVRSPHDDIIDSNTSKSMSTKSQCLEIDSLRDPHYNDAKPNKCEDANSSLMLEQTKISRTKSRCTEDSSCNQFNSWMDFDNGTTLQHDESRRRTDVYAFSSSQWHNGVNRNLKGNIQRTPLITCVPNNSDKSHPLKNRMRDGYDWHSSRFNQQGHGSRYAPHNSIVKAGWEVKTFSREQTSNASRQLNNGNQHISRWNATDSPVLKGKCGTDNSDLSRGLHAKKVWEPRDSLKKCPKKSSDDIIIFGANRYQGNEGSNIKKEHEKLQNTPQVPVENCLPVVDDYSTTMVASSYDDCTKIPDNGSTNHFSGSPDEFGNQTMPCNYPQNVDEDDVDSCFVITSCPTSKNCDTLTCSSSSDNCSSCLSETDSNFNSSGARNLESSSTSDSEDASQLSEGRDISRCTSTILNSCQGRDLDKKKIKDDVVPYSNGVFFGYQVTQCSGVNITSSRPTENACSSDPSQYGYDTVARQQQMHRNSFGMTPFSAPMYHTHGQGFFPAMPTNGLISFPYPHQYVYPSSLGYGLPANQPTEFFMPYNVQPLTTSPVVNVSQPSVYRPVNKFNVLKLDEQMKNSRMKVNCQDIGSCDSTSTISAFKRQRDLNTVLSCKPPSIPENGAIKNSGESYKTSFSLFHSGGPVASAFNIDLKTLKGKCLPEEQTNTARLCDEKTVKQYNLFA